MTVPLILQNNIKTLKERLADYGGSRFLPTFKENLIKALRSGEYRRTTGKLINRENECCLLGVAARVMEQQGLVEIKPADERSGHASCLEVFDVEGNRYGGHETIPQSAASRVGLSCYLQDVLSSFNDTTPVADEDTLFAEVANIIEAHL